MIYDKVQWVRDRVTEGPLQQITASSGECGLKGPGAERHKDLIAERLWHVVAGAASQLDWRTAHEAAALAMHLGGIRRARQALPLKRYSESRRIWPFASVRD